MHLSLGYLSVDNTRNRFIWSLLSFQSGWINIGGFLACHRFVTHTTGFATQFGADISQMKWLDALGMLLIPVFFLFGSMFSAFYIDREVMMSRRARYHIVFFFISVLLFLVTSLGSAGLFGDFGTDFHFGSDILLIAFLCFSAGLQNAAVSRASNNVVRTTHLTGLTTDLGIGLVRRFFLMQKNETPMNTIRGLLIGSFILGSTLGGYAFLRMNYLGFMIPLFFSIYIYITTLREFKKA